jgi:mannose-6-phosphate isomerase-like protein (cupin superfamily)
MSKLILGREFKEGVYYMNTALNPHYNSNDEGNKAVIAFNRDYDTSYINQDLGAIKGFEKKALKGKEGYEIGLEIEKHWGLNSVLDAKMADPLKALTGEGEDVVVKSITVFPNNMLSLQRHRGREETWEVESGILTVILDGKLLTVNAGESIFLPKGSVHCMINAHDENVVVKETQRGFCREADNVRLVDMDNRETVPLLTQSEGESAILYVQMEQKLGVNNNNKAKLTSPEYKKSISELKPTAA